MTFGIFYYSKECKNGILNGIELCVYLLMPSLFPFIFLSGFIVKSGASAFFEPVLNPVMRFMFGLPGICGTALILALVGGYPIGAKSIAELHSQGVISDYDAKKMSCFCISAGPGFLITFVGTGLFKSAKIGVLLFVCQSLTVILLGFICKFLFKDNNRNSEKKKTKKKLSFNMALINSAIDGTSAAINMCGLIISFCVIKSIAEAFFAYNNIENTFFLNLLEITSACNDSAGKIAIELIAFFVGWGGFCVHFQVFSFLKKVKINKLIFIAFRLLQGFLCALFFHFGLYFFPDTKNVFFSTAENFSSQTAYNGTVGSLGMIFTAVCLIYYIHNHTAFKKTI